MADSSQVLPVAREATRNQLLCLRLYHEQQVVLAPDAKSIVRSKHIIKVINSRLVTFQGKELKVV